MIWLFPLLDLFLDSRRVTLGKRLGSGIIEIMEYLVEAVYLRGNREFL